MPPTERSSRAPSKGYRILAPADWRERHLANGWDEERDGPVPAFGISYPPGRRAEAGDVVDNLPKESLAWLLAQGYVQEVTG